MVSESSTRDRAKMVGASGAPDIEKDVNKDHLSVPVPVNQPSPESSSGHHTHQISTVPFTGRLGGNQAFVLDRDDAGNAAILHDIPDAAPWMTLADQFDLRPFRTPALWKGAILEGMEQAALDEGLAIAMIFPVSTLPRIYCTLFQFLRSPFCVRRSIIPGTKFPIRLTLSGTLLLVFLTIWISLSPAEIPTPPDPQFGPFDNAAFLGPLVGGVGNFMLLTLFTFIFGAVSGAHLNPTITIATFCARLTTLPRMVLYVAFQTIGGALAGLLVRAAYGSRHFKAGGCWLYPNVVPVGDAFVIEFVATTLLLFFAFGVGLDPRQRQLIGPSLAPFLVGMALGVITFGTAFTRYGYGGASLNPARCLGAFVGSSFPGWHWHHWVADIVACLLHAVFYLVVPPWQKYG